MAADLMGGALLSASLQVLFEKMASPEIVTYLTGKKSSGLDVLLRKLKIKLSSVNAVLDDAEYKQIRNRGVKDWLDELQDAVFNAEDLLADIEADALQRNMEPESRTSLSKVSNFFSFYDSTDRERKAEIEELLGRLEYIASQKDILGLKELVVGKNSSWRLPSTSLVEESGVYGRDEDKDVNFSKLSNFISEATHLRSIVIPYNYAFDKKVEDSLLKAKHLRVLSLPGPFLKLNLPDSINELRQLRYVNLSQTSIERLPESLSKLHNLQTLKLAACLRLTMLPKDFNRLINLRYLNVEFSGLVDMPTRMGKLKSLQKLSTFIVGKDGGTKIGELGELADLTGKLHHRNYRMVVLDNLLPNTTLKKLLIRFYGGTKFPHWLGDQSFYSLVDVQLSDCKYCYILPPLGQLSSLKSLYIGRCRSVARVGPEFYGNSSSSVKPFASLESLSFDSLSNWEEWLVPDEAFPMLTRLSVYDCKKLVGDLPCFLPYLTVITIDVCPQLACSLPMIPNVGMVALCRCEMITGYNLFESFGCLEVLEICKSLDSTTCRSLPASLKRLKFYWCKNLEFPPFHSYDCPNLTQLWIYKCENVITSRMSRNLQGLPKLTRFSITNCTFDSNLESFPEEGLLPSIIAELEIDGLEWLKTLDSNGLQQLTSLTSLSIKFCYNLQTITEPGLPSSLQTLKLNYCPLMKEKCERERGEYWNKIAPIPNITYDAETRIISVVFTLVARSQLQNGSALMHGDHWNVARSATLVMNFCKTLGHECGKRPINASSTEKFQLIFREDDEFEKCWEMLTIMGAKPVKL
ncbi:hypothetical protein TIFTF001_012604 [Ficus carica]|uniref:Rx N-terminal domain-containing protein n=1 Tax=Ficus carica TaxID=3494 RepID=A0AA87ZW77_FICCA|nr:hypothetical protein TIFTF001_012604 [Ficus carica]